MGGGRRKAIRAAVAPPHSGQGRTQGLTPGSRTTGSASSPPPATRPPPSSLLFGRPAPEHPGCRGSPGWPGQFPPSLPSVSLSWSLCFSSSPLQRAGSQTRAALRHLSKSLSTVRDNRGWNPAAEWELVCGSSSLAHSMWPRAPWPAGELLPVSHRLQRSYPMTELWKARHPHNPRRR